MSPASLALAAAGVLFVATVTPAQAASITYTETGIVSGMLNGTAFSNKAITVTLTGNTSGVSSSNGLLLNSGVATGAIAGFAPFTFSGPAAAFASYHTVVNTSQGPGSVAGIGQLDFSGVTGILAQLDPALYGYDLKNATTSSTGGFISTGSTSTFGTSAGNLQLTSGSNIALTVTGGDALAVALGGGTLANPTSLTASGVGEISGTIGGFGTSQYYEFYWAGGVFGASASVGGAQSVDTYALNLFDINHVLLTTGELNQADRWNSSVSGNLAAGNYILGLVADNPADPLFSLAFAAPVSAPVPEPTALLLVGTGIATTAARFRRARNRSRRS